MAGERWTVVSEHQRANLADTRRDVFVYKGSHNIWNLATSLSFVAKHTYCRAIYKSEVEKHFGDAKNMLKLINTNSTLTSAQKEVLVWNEIQ